MFRLGCECSLDKKEVARGFCPIPKNNDIREYIYWVKRMWLRDNCHTYDRAVLSAQKECGIGTNFDVLKNVAKRKLKLDWFPYIMGGEWIEVNGELDWENYFCFDKILPESKTNLFKSKAIPYLV